MAYTILTDITEGRSVLYCTTSERPLDCEAFLGSDCYVQAEDFLEWLDCDPRDENELARRGYVSGAIGNTLYPPLDHAQQAWRKVAFNDADEFVGHPGGTIRSDNDPNDAP